MGYVDAMAPKMIEMARTFKKRVKPPARRLLPRIYTLILVFKDGTRHV